MRVVDLTDKNFGLLKCLNRNGSINGEAAWHCLCQCGNTTTVRGSSLRRGHTTSCGCFNKRRTSQALRKGLGTVYTDLYGRYRQGAQRRKIKFGLTVDEFSQMIKLPCSYCGLEPYTRYSRYLTKNGKWKSRSKKYSAELATTMTVLYNGIDRVDSTKGYSPDNCVPCCKLCNTMKLSLKKDEFLEHVSKIYERAFNGK